MQRDPAVPTDAPLAEVVDRIDADGHEAQFQAVEGGGLRCLSCRETFAAGDVTADQVTRLEGESDPADMAIVIPVGCPHCGAEGTFVAQYGPGASEAEADVLVALDRTPAEGSGGAASPGQVGISTPGNG